MARSYKVPHPIETVGPISRMISAKDYLDKNKIPQMFQSFIASLMLERPENCYEFLDDKVEQVKTIGIHNVHWETFIYHLHPERDPARQKLVQPEDPKEKYIKEPPEEEEDFIQADIYEPEVFKLTEAKE